MKKGEECVLYDRKCNECGECMRCDLNPFKICDNCGKCIDGNDVDFNAVKITAIDDACDADWYKDK